MLPIASVGAGNLTLELRAKAAYKARLKRLKGTSLTLRITQSGKVTSRTLKLE